MRLAPRTFGLRGSRVAYIASLVRGRARALQLTTGRVSTTEKAEKKTKGMCIATRCTSVEQFIQMFHRFVDEESFFVSTLNTRPPGLETSFSVQLVDGTPVLRGLCVVMQSWTDANNPFKTPGVRLGIKRLTANSMAVFERLLVTRSATKPPPFNGAPTPITPVATKPGGVPAPKLPAPPASSLAVVVAVPKSIPAKGPYTETAPTKSAPSRLELKTPVRPSSEPPAKPDAPNLDAKSADPPRSPLAAKLAEVAAKKEKEPDLTPTPIPAPIPPEITDLTEEPTDVREPKKPVRELGAMEIVAQVAAPADLPKPIADDSRTPGSELVLPANPLMNMSDASLEGYVDCTLYEETGNFFPAEDTEGFIDDVAPPPPLGDARARASTPPPIDGELRARTITPLPPAPIAGFDSLNDDSSREAPRYETQPKAAAYEPRGAGTATRESAPSILVPPPVATPPMPKESVMVDPALIARGSTPAFDADYDSVSISPAARGLPLPAPRRSDRMPTAARKKRTWLLLGGLGVLAAIAAVVIVVVMPTSTGGAAPPESKKPVKELAQIAPPVPDKAPVGEGSGTDEVEEEPAPGEGPPVVGAGPCSVVVNTTPAGSIVTLDDQKQGPSPITVAASCDKHKLDVEHARYQPATKQITLTEGKPQSVEVTLNRPTHIVTVTSNPPGATIFIDGRRAGTTPTKLSVLGFVTVKLEFKKTGFQPSSARLYSRYPNDQVGVRLTKW